jgi:hypothetical protein
MLKTICDHLKAYIKPISQKSIESSNGSFDYVDFILQMKKQKKGLMSKKQYLEISRKLIDASPCNLLVFGLGEDSYLWDKINNGGVTIFLEDSVEWIAKTNDGTLTVKQVKYHTDISEHHKIGFNEEKLKMDLPEEVRNLDYDFIIVDAPLGHQPPRPYKGPGRMSSIYTASKLLKFGGTAVVDDMGRKVEEVYAFHYFGKKNLVQLIEKKVGIFEINNR